MQHKFLAICNPAIHYLEINIISEVLCIFKFLYFQTKPKQKFTLSEQQEILLQILHFSFCTYMYCACIYNFQFPINEMERRNKNSFRQLSSLLRIFFIFCAYFCILTTSNFPRMHKNPVINYELSVLSLEQRVVSLARTRR